MNDLITLDQLMYEFNMPAGLIYLYERMGMPFTWVGGLKRYNLQRVKSWYYIYSDRLTEKYKNYV